MDTSSQTNSSGYEKLSLLLLNINGLRNKTDDIRQIIARHQLHVVALCETNLDSTVKDSQVYIEGFRMWRRDRGSNGGGVALYVQDHIETRLRSDLIKTRVEMIWVEMKLPGSRPVLLGCFYRTKENLKHLVQIYEIMIEVSKEKEEKDILLMGDFNIDWFSPHQDNVAFYFSSKCGLTQIVEDDTRHDRNSSSCIDHIYTNIPDRCSRPKSTKTSISDHNLVTVKVGTKVPKWIRMCRSNRFRPKEFKKAIEGSSWQKVYKAADPEEALSKFTKKFLLVADEHAPLQNKDIYGLLRSDELERSLSLIDQVKLKEFNREYYGVDESEEGTPTMEDMTESSSEGEEVEQEVEDLINKKQEKDFQQQIDETKDCPEKLLTAFKQCLDECLPSHVISIKPEGDVISETEHLENLHPTNTETSDSDSSSEGSPSKKRRPEAFRFEDTDPETVKRLLEHLCDRVLCGLDQTEAELMKLGADKISAPISHILNKVLSKDVFPDELKKHQKCSYNYVHFRQTCSADRIHIMLGYIFDMILYLQTKEFFTKKQLIPSLDIMETLESDWLRASEANQTVGAVFLDFSSSFNTISHDLLMNKLRTSGFSASALSLIKRFLSDHEGLPPGSVLAKLLFTFYINDLVYSK